MPSLQPLQRPSSVQNRSLPPRPLGGGGLGLLEQHISNGGGGLGGGMGGLGGHGGVGLPDMLSGGLPNALSAALLQGRVPPRLSAGLGQLGGAYGSHGLSAQQQLQQQNQQQLQNSPQITHHNLSGLPPNLTHGINRRDSDMSVGGMGLPQHSSHLQASPGMGMSAIPMRKTISGFSSTSNLELEMHQLGDISVEDFVLQDADWLNAGVDPQQPGGVGVGVERKQTGGNSSTQRARARRMASHPIISRWARRASSTRTLVTSSTAPTCR